MLPFKGKNRLTSPYGARVLNGVTSQHKGIDLVGDDNNTVHAVAGGTVVQSRIVTDKTNPTWQWGNYVCIKTAGGMLHYYCHLNSRTVQAGHTVNTGDAIGVMGSTGYSTGPHLHFEVRSPAGASIDPCPTLGIENTPGIYYGTGNATSPPTTGQEKDMRIKIFAPTGKTPSSQLLKEGWILDGDGRMFNPHGDARMAKEYEGDISAAFEAMRAELQPGEILMAVD